MSYGAEPLPKSSTTEKQTDQDQSKAAPQSSVTFIYEAKVVEVFRNVTVTWGKSLVNYSVNVSLENPSDESNPFTCKIDVKTWQFWGKKGLKSFDVDGKRIDVYWDFRQAKFTSNPEPSSDYYVALVQDEEVVLLLGDLKKDAYKRTKKRPTLEEPTLLCKKENVYGKKLFCTKTMLSNSEKEHDLVLEISSSGLGDPEMWVSIDGYEVMRVMNLHWRFRGNEEITVNNTSLQVFWDVHDWLFGSSASTGHGLFIFKPGSLEGVPPADSVGDVRYDSPPRAISTPTAEFFHVIYAWKLE